VKTSEILENSVRNNRHISYSALISDDAGLFGDIYSTQSRNKTTCM